jgi:hypothetical protein
LFLWPSANGLSHITLRLTSLSLSLLLIVSVESESAYTPEEIFPAAVNIMRDKIKTVKEAVEALRVDMGLAEGPREGEDGMDTS